MKKNRLEEIEIKQKIEIDYWANSLCEGPTQDSIFNIINKISDAEVFLSCIFRHYNLLPTKGKILELGGGQGWASCVYKKVFPETQVISTDISKSAIASLHRWERIFGVKIDVSYHCKSNDIKEVDASIDFIFCFAAAHHFLTHRRTLCEIKRVLRPGGKAIYFYEPTTPKLFYPLAHWRVNRKRPEVPEDVLIIKNLKKISAELNLSLEIDYYPSTLKRGFIEKYYYYILKKIPFLQKLLPSTANLIFTKN